MDRMSIQLQDLIEQGQKALNKEIVVMDDTVTDQEQGIEDDGSHDWEDDEAHTRVPLSRARSTASFTLAPALSRSVSQRDLHAPVGSPYKLPPFQSSHTKSTTSSAPPSSWSANRTRTGAPSLRAAPSFEVLSRSQSQGVVAASAPRPIARRQTDAERFLHNPDTLMAGPLNAGEEIISGSPEMKEFMERARRARLGQ